MDSCFFGNSGAEANEAAIKLARLHGRRRRGIDRPIILTARASFHGRTLAAVTATGHSHPEVVAAIENGTVPDCLHSFHPEAGDVVYLPSGTVHAIGGGIVMVPAILALTNKKTRNPSES